MMIGDAPGAFGPHALRIALNFRHIGETGCDMSHKHINLLRAIFEDPIRANIHWREIESLLHHLGADIAPAHGARFRVLLNGVEGFLHYPHHGSTCSKQEIKLLREYLASAGMSPSAYEAGRE